MVEQRRKLWPALFNFTRDSRNVRIRAFVYLLPSLYIYAKNACHQNFTAYSYRLYTSCQCQNIMRKKHCRYYASGYCNKSFSPSRIIVKSDGGYLEKKKNRRIRSCGKIKSGELEQIYTSVAPDGTRLPNALFCRLHQQTLTFCLSVFIHEIQSKYTISPVKKKNRYD